MVVDVSNAVGVHPILHIVFQLAAVSLDHRDTTLVVVLEVDAGHVLAGLAIGLGWVVVGSSRRQAGTLVAGKCILQAVLEAFAPAIGVVAEVASLLGLPTGRRGAIKHRGLLLGQFQIAHAANALHSGVVVH